MESAQIDWELEERGQAVFQAAAEMFGERRFARGWYDRARIPTLHICAVEPARHEIVALDHMARQAGWAFAIHYVRYSFAELLGFYETLSAKELPGGDAWVSFGLDDMANALRFVLRWPDREAMDFVREGLPADAIRFEIHPRAGRAIAAI